MSRQRSQAVTASPHRPSVAVTSAARSFAWRRSADDGAARTIRSSRCNASPGRPPAISRSASIASSHGAKVSTPPA